MQRRYVLIGTAASLLALAGPAFAEAVSYKANLDGKSETPPNDSNGKGLADVKYDSATKTLSWIISFNGLSGDPVAAHFHGPADAGQKAGPVVDISKNINSGSATITDEQAQQLADGKWYVNIHTQKFPDGEIRGQVTK